MKEKDRENQSKISDSLVREIQPWLKAVGANEGLNQDEIFSGVSVALLSLARRVGLSVESAKRNLPEFLRISHNRNYSVELQIKLRGGIVPVKKTIRKAVIEPPIRGIRNGGKRFDEERFSYLLHQEERRRQNIIITPVDIDRTIELRKKRQRGETKSRLATRWGDRGFEKDAPTPLDNFMPESIEFTGRDIHQVKMEKTDFSFNDLLSLTALDVFSPRACEGTIHERIDLLLRSVLTKRANVDITHRVVEMAKQEGRVRFGTMCLPCLNPNPFITDHPSITVNVPTVLFLERMNSFAHELERIVEVPVRFFLARELEHMSVIFPLSPDEILQGIRDLELIITKRNLTHIQICEFPVSCELRSGIRPHEAKKFFLAFKRSQVNFALDPVTHLRWLGIIDDVTAKKAARKRDVDLETQLRETSSMEALAHRQAELWAAVRESPWKESPNISGSIIVSVRPGSQNSTIIPVSRNSSENFPMLPQHCSVGIGKNGQIMTMKRAEFLVHPFRWVEAITEHGAMFVHRALL